MPQVDLFKNKTAFPLIFGTIMTLSIIWGAIGYGWMKNYGVTYAYLGYDLDGDKDDPLYCPRHPNPNPHPHPRPNPCPLALALTLHLRYISPGQVRDCVPDPLRPPHLPHDPDLARGEI